jgi:hypothetical protein
VQHENLQSLITWQELYTDPGNNFDLDEVRWEMIGPVFENHLGIMFRFPVNLIADSE